MLSKFIFVLSLITNEGELQMKAFDVDQCPEVQQFSQEMNNMKSQGKFIGWNAICIQRDAKQQDAMR